jgi:transporter family-2 protein
MVVDHVGWIGVERQPITLVKLAGLALVAAGTWLIVWD